MGTLAIGFGGGFFSVGTLAGAMARERNGESGLALGAWGAVQASAAGLAIAFGGVLRDLVALWTPTDLYRGAVPYDCVYALEIAFLLATLALMAPLFRRIAVLA